MKSKFPNSKITLILFASFITTAIFYSCRKDVKNENQRVEIMGNEANQPPYVEDSDIVLGTPKQNPYTVTNMSSAYSALAARGILPVHSVNIRRTHYYVKFKPTNNDQYEALCADSTLDLSSIPIEATITRDGDGYHDPSLPDSVPTYQYAAVPVDYVFNDTIPYEIISELYIPESDNIYFSQGNGNESYREKLLDEAYVRTGNADDTLKYDSNDPLRCHTPAGRIQVFDTRLGGLIGLEGVRVEARRWFTVLHGFPDYYGYYSMNGCFNRPCNYSLWYNRSQFDVRKHVIGLTYWINGPKTSGNWNLDITEGYRRFISHVFRGAFRYYIKDIGGLKRPGNKGRWNYIASSSYGGPGVNWTIIPVIQIGRYEDPEIGLEFDSDEIFSATCHETGHASHMYAMSQGILQYWQVDAELRESWAVAIEWYLTHLEYSERGIGNYGDWNFHSNAGNGSPIYPNTYAYQYWNKGGYFHDYTPLYIDIVDDHNEVGVNYQFSGTGSIKDEVSGYTLPNIESDMLKHIYGLSSLAEQLKSHKPAGITDTQIDELLSYY